jgi:phospholipid/cholesterol/gamma-HCH transport system substrate-binding protein
MKKTYMREMKVGLVIVIALVIIIGFVFTLGGNESFFRGKIHYQILFNSTAGLYEGDPVLLTGVEVGNVSSIGFPKDLNTKKIVVQIGVEKDVSKRIRRDSRAMVGSASLVYGKVVELTIGSPDQPIIPENGWIEAIEKSNFTAVVDSTRQVMGGIQSVINKIDHGQGVLGMLLNHPMEMQNTFHHLSQSSEKLSMILQRLEEGKGTIGSLLSDSLQFEETMNDLQTAIADLKQITLSLKSQNTVLGRFINDEKYGKTVTEDLKKTLQALANIATKIDTAEGSVGLFVNDPELYIGLQDIVYGVERSRLTKWMIRNRRKAGENARNEGSSADEDEEVPGGK